MPRQSVWFIKASFLYLVVGFTIGGLMLANKGILFSSLIITLLPMHMEFLLLGWLVQLAMGVVFWISPRFTGTKPRGNLGLINLVFWVFNIGVLFVSFAPYLYTSGLKLIGKIMELISVVGFGVGTWNRIKPSRKEHV